MLKLRLIGVCALMGLALPASAQDCRHSPLIAAMTGHRINGPVPRNALLASVQVAEAAYLDIHYRDLVGDEIETLLDGLDARYPGSPALQELREIYALSEAGGVAGWAADDDATFERFRTAGPATVRALILADGGTTFLRLLKATQPETAQDFPPFAYGPRPALYLTDQGDAFRVAFGEQAEAAGALSLAAAIFAGHSGPQVFEDFQTRNLPFFAALPDGWRWRYVPYSDEILAQLLEDRLTGSTENGSYLAEEYRVVQAATATFPISFLGIYHTQSGAQSATYPAARAVLDAVSSGAADPLGNPEMLWVLAYRQLLQDAQPDQVRDVLAGFDLYTNRRWHDGRSALAQLDVMVAKDVLRDYVAGQIDTMPDAPDGSTVAWDTWALAATLLRDDHLNAAFEINPVATIELLWDAGKYAVAWGLTMANSDVVDTASLASDLSERLDMLCDQRTILPALRGRYGRERLMHFP